MELDFEGFDTILAHLGEDREGQFGAVAPPIYQSSLFTFPNCEAFTGWQDSGRFMYTRVGNPTTAILEAKVAALEKGERALTFASGMGAVAAAVISCVKSDEHVVCVDSAYGPTRMLMADLQQRFRVAVSYVEGSSTQDFADAIEENTRLIYLESPSSFHLRLQDLQAVANLARAEGIVTICDNSWASPYFQKPLELGVDLVVHSATKYLGGHSDVLGGLVVGGGERMKRIAEFEMPLLGATADPFGAWLILRGIRTLGVRMERHQETAMRVARFLEEHPAIARVNYPGLDSHPQRALARRQQSGNSGLLSFTLKAGDKAAAYRFVNSLQLFSIGCSWGGYESLAIPVPLGGDPGHREWGARLSLGLETADDLLADLAQALG